MGPSEDRRCDFFVSYTKTDEVWAVWIAWIVEEMGFQTMVQAWDFPPGTNWIQKMNAGLQGCARLIAVLSPDYLNSVYGAAEWQAAADQQSLQKLRSNAANQVTNMLKASEGFMRFMSR